MSVLFDLSNFQYFLFLSGSYVVNLFCKLVGKVLNILFLLFHNFSSFNAIFFFEH